MTPYDFIYQKNYIKDDQTTEANSNEDQESTGKRILKLIMMLNFIKIKRNEDGTINLSEMFVISHLSGMYLIFNFFVTACCLVSSYIYVYMAAFRILQNDFSMTNFFMYFFEGVFVVDIAVNFMLSYEYMGQYGKEIQRNLFEISNHYVKTTFIKDLIPIIPFQLIPLPKERGALFYLIKLLRLAKGFRLLDVFTIMKQIKEIYKNYSIRRIKNDPRIALDTLADHNKVQ